MPEVIESVDHIRSDKAAFLDLGGTLVDGEYLGSTLGEINRALGIGDDVDMMIYNRHIDEDIGGIGNHAAHAEELEMELRAVDPTIEDFVEGIRTVYEDRRVLEGAESFVDNLQERGYTTIAISSSPKALSLMYSDELGIEMIYDWKDYIFDEQGQFEALWVNPEASGGKQEAVERYDGETAYFGNGSNDKRAANTADISLRQEWSQNPLKSYREALEVLE
ncbi:hypothetical protein GLU60_01405 [Nanohaloarchaea archaeon H01]|nr:hypothetical protein [Nanohaloarchaea archaeon H01]